jgi:hypothetical protein
VGIWCSSTLKDKWLGNQELRRPDRKLVIKLIATLSFIRVVRPCGGQGLLDATVTFCWSQASTGYGIDCCQPCVSSGDDDDDDDELTPYV